MKRIRLFGMPVLLCVFSISPVLAEPIHDAADAGRVGQLIDGGADVNAKTDDATTPLHSAAVRGHRDVAEVLLSKGADVHARNINGWTPLHSAANGDHKNVAELLLEQGANVDARAVNGWTPLHVAALLEHTGVSSTTAQMSMQCPGKMSRRCAFRQPDVIKTWPNFSPIKALRSTREPSTA